MDHHRSTMCHLEGAFPHDFRWFSAYAAKWLGVSSGNEIEIINDSSRDSVNHVNFLRIEISSEGKECVCDFASERMDGGDGPCAPGTLNVRTHSNVER